MYDILLQTSPEPIFIYDLENLKFLDMNEATLKLYGYGKEEFLNMDLTDLYAPEDIQTLIESSNNHVAENIYSGPYRHKKKDGSSILVKISKTSIDYNGRKAHFNIVKDVTKDLEKDKNISLYKYIFDNSSDLIITTDIHGFITFSNKEFLSKLGYSAAEVNKTPINSFLGQEDKSLFNSAVFRADLQDKKVISASLKHKNGTLIKSDIVVSPVKDFKGVTDTFAFIFSVEGNESKSVKSTSENDSSSELDSSFLSHLFHEILTPINVIIGFGQELIDSIENPTSEQKESTDIILENQKSLLQIMDTAGEYASLAQKNVTLEPQEVTFVDLIDEFESSTKKNSELYKTKLNYGKISSSLNFVTDKHRFITLVSTYVSFGMKLTHNTSIYLSAQPYDEDHFVISIKDEKTTITNDLVNGLRDIFSQDENIIRQRHGFSRFSVRLLRKLLSVLNAKTGLVKKGSVPTEYGIIIPNELVVDVEAVKETETDSEVVEFDQPEVTKQVEFTPKSYDNNQKVNNNNGKDIIDEVAEEEASFDDFEFETPPPVKKQEQKPVFKQFPKKEFTPSKPQKSDKLDLKHFTCLYLEDQVDSQILFKVQMKDLKKIEVANSLEKAFPIIENQKFDFIVMDINLQGEYNGLDALKIIRQLPGYQAVPIIAVTAYVLPGDKEKFIAAGFNDFISKPVLRENLYSTLEKVFNQ